MSKSLALYDEALQIGQLELRALQDSDVDLAESYCSQRAALLEEAWSLRDANNEQLRPKLLAMHDLQSTLLQEGKALRQNLQQQLMKSRQKKKGLNGYKKSVIQATAMLDDIQRFSGIIR